MTYTNIAGLVEMSKAETTDHKNVQKSQLSNQENKETSLNDRRNESERKRRNRFNGYIDELAAFIADRCTTKRSTEKSSILRLTIEYFHEQEILAAKRALKEPFGNAKPVYTTDDEFAFALMESACAFMFAVDLTGKLIYISDNVFANIGHLPGHIINRSVFGIIQAKDHLIFQGMLSALRADLTLNTVPSNANGGTEISRRFEPFSCQFCRGTHCRGGGFETFLCFPAIMRSFPKDKDAKLEFPDCLLVIAKPLNRVAFNATLLRSDGPQREFTATLNMEAKYDYLDKRVASVLGYFPSELIGSSLYDFCHFEDLDVLVEYHKMLLLTGRITTCYYRHLTKGQSWIWLQTRYHISYSDWSSKPQAVTSLSWVVPYEEVCEKQKEMLARDRGKFAQILEGQESADGKSMSSNSSSKLSVTENAAKRRTSEVRRTSDSSRTVSESSMEETPGPDDLRNNICATFMPADNADLMENELIEFERFLQRLVLPVESLSGAQQDLHTLLVERHTRLLNDISKQTKELEELQNQIKTQGELHELIEQLEEAKTKKEKELEITVTKEILNKFEEIRRASPGTQNENSITQGASPTTQSLASSNSSPLQETGAETAPHLERRSPLILSGEQMTENSLLGEVGVSLLSHWQNDIFVQENWNQTQAEQVQLQQQETLMQQMYSTGYIPQEQPMMMLDGAQQQMAWELHRDEANQLILSQEQLNQRNNLNSFRRDSSLLNLFDDVFLE